MPGTYSKLVTAVTGGTITAAERNNEHDNHITNATPAGVDDASGNVAAMQNTTDPYPAAVESLATDLDGELRRLRFVIKLITNQAQWYIDPTQDLTTVLPLAGGTLTGNLIFSPTTSGIKGTTTNDNATALNVGEYSEATIGSTAAPATGTYGDLQSISLTAGDWDVLVGAIWGINTATWTEARIGVSVTAGNSSTGLVNGQSLMQNSWASSATTPTNVSYMAHRRVSIAATTTVYLKFYAAYTAGSPTAEGAIWARRRR